MCRSLRDPRERTLRPKFSTLGGFLPLLTETSFTTSPYYSRYEVWAIINFFWYDPFKTRSSSFQISFCICTQIARGSESGMRLAPPAIRTIYQRPPPCCIPDHKSSVLSYFVWNIGRTQVRSLPSFVGNWVSDAVETWMIWIRLKVAYSKVVADVENDVELRKGLATA